MLPCYTMCFALRAVNFRFTRLAVSVRPQAPYEGLHNLSSKGRTVRSVRGIISFACSRRTLVMSRMEDVQNPALQ